MWERRAGHSRLEIVKRDILVLFANLQAHPLVVRGPGLGELSARTDAELRLGGMAECISYPVS